MENTLKELQSVQLEILILFDSICRKNNLKYTLYAGTQLGAVRHKGFIPWDDDLDVAMPREDYERFIEIWDLEKTDGYILQNKDNTPNFAYSFSKIRKDHTTFIQYDFEKGAYHTGIFIDIFPVDRIPDGKMKRMWFMWTCLRYQLYTREMVPPKGNFILRTGTNFLLKINSNKAKRGRKREKLLKNITKYSEDSALNMICIETTESLQQICPPDLMDDIINLEFEGRQFCSTRKYDEWLKLQFGDYMQLPPLEERGWTHHPIVIDFEHNYEELA